MKYVNKIKRGGVEYLYFRKAGCPSVKLNSAWGTPELQAEVDALIAGTTAPKPGSQTLRAHLRTYELESAEFKNLADSTKYEYRLVLKELEEDFGELHVSSFKPAFLMKLRNMWAERGHRVPALRLTILRNALLPAIVEGKHFEGDPFALIPGVRRPQEAKEPHLIWTTDVVLTVISAALRAGKPGLARGVALGRYTGARRGDLVKLTRAARKDGRFTFLSGKKRILVDMPEAPALTQILDGTPKGDSLVLAYNLSGRAYTEDGFALELGRIVRDLHKAGKLDSAEYNLHGLRHTFGVEAALAGCTDAEGAALMGHGSPHSFATYRRQADRIRLSNAAAERIAALRERTSNSDLQNELQNICKIAPTKAAKPRGRNARSSGV